MAKETKKVMKASEITGELARMQRVFEAFKDAATIANVLAGHETMERNLKKNISLLEKEEQSLDASCDSMADRVEKNKDKLSILDTKIASAQADYQALLRTAQQKANAEAASIVGASEARLVSLKKDIQDELKAKESVQKDVLTAKQELEEVKANALKALA